MTHVFSLPKLPPPHAFAQLLATGIVLIAAAAFLGTLVASVVVPHVGVALAKWGHGTTLPPRFLRLGLVSLFALPALTLLAPDAAWSPLRVGRRTVPPSVLAALLGVGMVLMPALLAASALASVQFKYGLAIPAIAFTAATAWVAVRGWQTRPWRRETLAWTTLGLSLAFGLTLGLFAFDGPLPIPHVLDDYTAPLRAWLRSTHHLSVTLSVLSLAWCRFRAR